MTSLGELIPHSRPTITDNDVNAVLEQLKTEYLACGSRNAEFEDLIATRHNYEEITCVNSGRIALQQLLNAAGIGDGDEVLLSSYVCSSVLHSVIQTGATPVFYDIDESWCPSAASIIGKLTSKSRAVIIIHIYGIDGSHTDLDDLPILVIDDLCQAFGLRPKFSPNQAAFFSFNATKCITTGEGGALYLRSDLVSNSGAIKSTHSDLQGSLGVSQERQYDNFLRRRHEIARFYLSELPESILGATWTISNRTLWFRFPVTIDSGVTEFCEKMFLNGVTVRRGVDALLHSEWSGDDSLEGAEKMFETTASLPIYPALTDSQVELICDAVKRSVKP